MVELFLENARADESANFLQLILALGVKKLERAVIIGFRDENLRGTAKIAVIRGGWIDKSLRGGDVVLLKHHDEHLGVDNRAGVEQFHFGELITDEHRWTRIKTD
jgi:hypothetical protein